MMQMEMTPSVLRREDTAGLQARILGQVYSPGDEAYQEARQAWNRTVNQYPELIVDAVSAGDVAEAVRFARRHSLGIAVQSTGHGITLAADGGMLILTSRMKEMRVDAQARTARISAGLMWGEVLAQTQAVGLAPLLGSSPGVGVVGYTLGGGIGWLGRKYGLAADSVIAFELVDANGNLLRASAYRNRELFWGLRGGGGSFGIITAMEIRLYPVETVYGGNLIYPASMAKEVMQRYREWIRGAPDELTSSIVLMNVPPAPQIPEMLRGKSVVMVRGLYSGPVEEGEALLRFWREWRAPMVDDFKAMPFKDVASVSSDPRDPMPSHSSGAWMRELSDEAIDAMMRYALPQDGPPDLIVVEARHVGGAIHKPDPSAAFSHREAELLLFAVGPAPSPEAYARVSAVIEELKREMEPALTGGVYMNFVHGQEARERTRQGYSPDTYRRLLALKTKVDPDNVFRFSFDFTPHK